MDFLKDLNNSLRNLAFCLQNRIFDLAVEDTFVRQCKIKVHFYFALFSLIRIFAPKSTIA